MRKLVCALVVIAAALVAFVWIAESGSAQGDSRSTVITLDPTTSQNQSSLAGTWKQIPDGMSGITMTAVVSVDSIQINIFMNGTSGIYWLGSFDPKIIAGSTLSQGDSDAMDLDIFASQDKTKLFAYTNGLLSYQFSMLGTTSTVYLSREAQS